MKKLLPLSALTLLSLPSCMELQVGAIIREPAQYAEAVDASKPRHNQAYKISDNAYVYQAPVIRGAYQRRLLYFNIGSSKFSPYYAGNRKATGAWQWVKIYRHKQGDFQATLMNHPPQLKGAKLVNTSLFDYTGDVPFNYGVQPTTTTRRILAAPFDYVIDPILSVPLTAITYGGLLVAAPFTMTQNQENDPAAIRATDLRNKPEKKKVYVSISYRNLKSSPSPLRQ